MAQQRKQPQPKPQPKAEEEEQATVNAVVSNPGEISEPTNTGPTKTKRPDGRVFEDY